jgi:carotenoid cleavage dioxygenase-like enzyme
VSWRFTHTAHPKFDKATGEMISYGYEAKGLATDDVYVFSANAKGQITWEAWIKVPYVGMVHDFAVSQKYIAFLVIPMATNVERMKQGQVHFAWDSTLPTWFGVLERDGDGKDVRWFRESTHHVRRAALGSRSNRFDFSYLSVLNSLQRSKEAPRRADFATRGGWSWRAARRK